MRHRLLVAGIAAVVVVAMTTGLGVAGADHKWLPVWEDAVLNPDKEYFPSI